MKEKYLFLYLEDSDLDVEIFRSALQKEGWKCTVDHVKSRQEFISALKDKQYDIIFSDYALPSFDGVSALEMVKNTCPGTPFIIISGNIGEELAIETLKRGATDYVLKSRFNRLVPSIQRALMEKRDREQIKEAESLKTRYDFIVNTSKSFMSMINRDYTYEAINNAFCTAHNLVREEIIGKRLVDLWGEESFRKAIKPNIDLSFANQEVHYQAWFDTPKFGKRCFEVAFYPFTDEEGNVTHTVVDTIDITEKKIAEQALKESEEKYRNLVELANDGIIIVRDKKIVFANSFVTKLSGYPIDQLLNHEVIEFIHPSFQEDLLQRYMSMLKGQGSPALFETVLVGKNGIQFQVEVNAGVIKYEGGLAIIVLLRDISERKKAQEALVESEERYKRVLEASNTGIWEWNISTGEVYFSPRWKTILGYKDKEIPNLFDEFANRLHPDDKNPVLQEMARFLEMPKGNFIREYRMKHKNGSYRWIINRAAAILDKNGQPLRMSGSHMDITDRKLSEEIVRESEEKFRNFAQQTPDGIAIANEEGKIIEWNLGMEKIIGIKRSEVMGMHAWEFIKKIYPMHTGKNQDMILMEKMIKDMLKTGISPWENGSVEMDITDKDGNPKILHMNMFPIKTAKGFMMGNMTRDMTEKITAEKELRTNRDFLASLNNAIGDAIITTRMPERVIEFANISSEQMFGYSQDELVGRNAEFLWPSMEDYHSYGKLLREAMDQKKDTMVVERQLRKKNSTLFDAELTVSFIKENGSSSHVLTIVRDITQRKKTALQIWQQTQDLTLINDLNEMANTGARIDQVLSVLWERTAEIFTSRGGAIYLVSDDESRLIFQHNRTARKYFTKVEKATKSRIGMLSIPRSSTSEYWRPMLSGKTCQAYGYENVEALIAEHQEIKNLKKFMPLLTKLIGIKHLVNIPLISTGQAIGILSIGKGELFTTEEIQRLESFAEQITSIIAKISTEEKSSQQREDLYLINELNGAVNEGKSLDEILNLIYKGTRRLFGGYGATIHIMKEDGTQLTPLVIGLSPSAMKRVQKLTGLDVMRDIWIDLKEASHYSKVIKTGKPKMCRSVEEIVPVYREFAHNQALHSLAPQLIKMLKIGVLLTVPMKYRDQTIGVLDISRNGLYSDHDIERISTVTNQVTTILTRKMEEDRRKDSEVRYRTLFENANDAILLLKNGVFIDCNEKGKEIYGVEKEGIVGKTPVDFSPEIQPNGVSSTVQAAIYLNKAEHNEPQTFEWLHQKVDGTLVWVEVNLNRFVHKGEKLIQAIVRDITERKKAEENQLRLITAIEQSAETVVITDTHGMILYANPAFEHTTGYGRVEAIGKNPRLLKSGKHDIVFYENLWKTISSGKVWHGQFVNKRKDGSFYDEQATISPIKDEDGRIVNYVAVKRDVTRERQLEAQLQQSQKMETIGTLAGGLAHDFNNILATIMGYADMATKEVAQNTELHDDLSNILKASNRGKDLVKKILTFSRQFDVRIEPVDFAKVIRESVELLKASVPPSIRIVSDICEKCDKVMADQTQLQQVFLNLSTNAAYAMKDKGGLMQISLRQVIVEESNREQYPTLHHGNYLHLKVVDSGTGMDQKIIERIFEPFFTTKPVGEGTGLGLAVTHGIVKNLRGEIIVESEPGKGSAFHVYIPVGGQGQEAFTELPKEDISIFGSERILFVDDDPEITTMIKKMLEKIGYKVTTFSSPYEAMALFHKDPEAFDMVITDLVMPDMNGEQLSEEILKIKPGMPVILITGYRETVTPERIRAFGNRRLLYKPLTMTELGITIRTIFDTKSK